MKRSSPRDPLPAPSSYALLVTGTLASHSEDAQRLARAAALLPEGSVVDLVAGVADVEHPQQALEDLSRAPAILISTDGPRGWTVRFPHPLVRAAVYDDTGPHAQATLHARAGELLTGDAALNHLVAASNGPRRGPRRTAHGRGRCEPGAGRRPRRRGPHPQGEPRRQPRHGVG